ncbi:NADPH-dependent F420 reductase [Brachybacterium kimchii]|uniref:NAD(P)-binding domain-containing protein n=1 Tax=Brachybacterium kimchii TaxID=2942909 RepID=A0ABY4N228_9MICO|nr:NAD(P)-binding domain-containing protein [Brachybacterium kimchii]UQN28620.1 NAD(P)-binding domain-containing protein [Brachybacterium kimchii]
MADPQSLPTIGTIGAGHIGSTVARLAQASGIDVVLSNSRGPSTLEDLAQDIGSHVRAGTTAEAAASDIVVLTVPLLTLTSLDPELLAGRIVVDTMNHYPERDGKIPALDSGATTSGLTAAHFPDARVVKGLNNIVYSHLLALARPSGAPDRSALPIAGDDADAKAEVTHLLDALGYDALDAGPLSEGWRFERGREAYTLPYAADPEALRASTPGARPKGARPASTDVLRRALAEA